MRSLTLLLLALSVTITGSADKVANMPRPAGYVDDYAGVMSADGKAAVDAICRDVHDKTKAQIFFVTIKSLEGESIETFSSELFHNWKIGEKGTDRGILLLLAVNDHKRRIEVGYGLEGILPDAKAGRIGRDMVPALKANDYDGAALTGVKEISDVIAADAKVTLDDTTPQPLADSEQPPPPVDAAPPTVQISGFKSVFVLFPFLGFFALFGFVIWRSIKRGVRFGSGGASFRDSSNSSGSSFSSSSSDDSFSGGDGGDSGGGGASGDW